MKRGEYLAEKRLQSGLSEKQLAEKLGASEEEVRQWEAGAFPDAKYLLPLSEILGADTEEILRNCSILNVRMGGIYVEDKLEAFSIGSYNEREKMAIIHIEKALYSYTGVYPALVQAMVPYSSAPVKFYKWWKKHPDSITMSYAEKIRLFLAVDKENPKALLKADKALIGK